MDLFDVTVGFLVGTVTGAAGTYFSDVFTDQRRAQKATKEANSIWIETQSRFPALIAEMRADLAKPELVNVRTFYVKSSTSTIWTEKAAFEYHTDVHPELPHAIAHLEEVGYIKNITQIGKCPEYNMLLPFIGNLRKIR